MSCKNHHSRSHEVEWGFWTKKLPTLCGKFKRAATQSIWLRILIIAIFGNKTTILHILCDRNPDLGTLGFQIRTANVFPSQKILKKELILNQQYLPHLDPDSTDLSFEIGKFFKRSSNLLSFFWNSAQKLQNWLENCYPWIFIIKYSTTQLILNQWYLLHKDSDSIDFFVWNWVFST